MRSRVPKEIIVEVLDPESPTPKALRFSISDRTRFFDRDGTPVNDFVSNGVIELALPPCVNQIESRSHEAAVVTG